MSLTPPETGVCASSVYRHCLEARHTQIDSLRQLRRGILGSGRIVIQALLRLVRTVPHPRLFPLQCEAAVGKRRQAPARGAGMRLHECAPGASMHHMIANGTQVIRVRAELPRRTR